MMDKNTTRLLDFFHIMEYLINSITHHFLKMVEKNTEIFLPLFKMQAYAYEHTFPNPISNKKTKTDKDKEQSSEKQCSNRFIY